MKMRLPKLRITGLFVWLWGYLLAAGVLLLLRNPFIWPKTLIDLLGVIGGGWIGFMMVELDKIAYVLFLHPESQVAQYVKYYVEKKNYKRAWEQLKLREKEMIKLTSRSGLFQAVWVVLAFFALTSVPSWFGRVLVMSLGLRILIENWLLYKQDKMSLKRRLFWQIQREFSNQELKWYMWVTTGLFVWLSLMIG